MIPECKCSLRRCKHYLGILNLTANFTKSPGEETMEELVKLKKHYCEAFLQGIPDVVAYGDIAHYHPIVGQQNNIVFELADRQWRCPAEHTGIFTFGDFVSGVLNE